MSTLIIQDAFEPYYSGRASFTRDRAAQPQPKRADDTKTASTPRSDRGKEPEKEIDGPQR